MGERWDLRPMMRESGGGLGGDSRARLDQAAWANEQRERGRAETSEPRSVQSVRAAAAVRIRGPARARGRTEGDGREWLRTSASVSA